MEHLIFRELLIPKSIGSSIFWLRAELKNKTYGEENTAYQYRSGHNKSFRTKIGEEQTSP
eukprot:1221594-Amphidinium_carterae.1